MEQVHDKIDRLGAGSSILRKDLVSLRGEMVDVRSERGELRGEMMEFRNDAGKTLRQIQGDIVALEHQNIARHGVVLNVLRRLDDIGLAMEDEGSRHRPS